MDTHNFDLLTEPAAVGTSDLQLLPAPEPTVLPFNRHAVAGRRGAARVHDLARLGRLYEEEHGLSAGRQRLKQLIQQGRKYEADHGLAAPQRPRRKTRARAWDDFLRALAGVVRPEFRADLDRLTAVVSRPATDAGGAAVA